VIPTTTEATGTISKSFRKISEQHIWEAWHLGNAENNHTGHCAHASENTNVEVQNVYRGK